MSRKSCPTYCPCICHDTNGSGHNHEGRECPGKWLPGRTVHVHRNLNKKCWSVLHKGIVAWHTDFTIYLKDVSFHVQPAGRARVLREKRKNVHAYAKGVFVVGPPLPDPKELRSVSYDPYLFDKFVMDDGTPIEKAELVIFDGWGKVLVKE